MKESKEFHKKEMDLLYKQLNESRQESLKIMEGIKQEQKEKIEKYEEEKKEKKKKKRNERKTSQ